MSIYNTNPINLPSMGGGQMGMSSLYQGLPMSGGSGQTLAQQLAQISVPNVDINAAMNITPQGAPNAGGVGGIGSIPGTPGSTGPGGASGFFGDMDFADTAGLALSGLQTLGGLWAAFNANKLAKRQFNFTKDITERNLANQTQSYNTSIADRGRTRAAVENQGQAYADDYIRRNSLPTSGG